MAEVQHPLRDIRVLDLGRHQAGPRCAQVLARMGAEVIKVERLGGEETRYHGPWVRKQSAYWVQYNTGKKSLSIDMRKDEAKEILKKLVKVSDVLVQNFRPGTIENMGFGYDVLKSLNPKIVMINVSAYGQYGPYRDRVGFDPLGQAIGGLMTLTGFPDDPPIRTFFPLIDRITALHATIGALAALRERDISGEGQAIDVCLADTGFTVNEIPISAYLGNRTIQQREGNGAGLSNAYQTADGWVYMAANNDAMWKRVCEALEKPQWGEDTRFATRAGRAKHASDLEPDLVGWFMARTTEDAVEYLSGFSVPCCSINNVEQAANEPHLHQREVMVEVPDPIAGSMYVTGEMIKFSRTPIVVGSAPTVGEHTEEVLRDILGYSHERIQSLLKEEVIRGAGKAAVSG